MADYQLYLISNNGSLMKCMSSREIDSNLQIDVGAMLFSMQAMSCSINPTTSKPSAKGFVKIRTEKSVWTCFVSLTGLRIFLETSYQNEPVAEDIIQGVYRAYADFVLKNPFSILGQPIKA